MPPKKDIGSDEDDAASVTEGQVSLTAAILSENQVPKENEAEVTSLPSVIETKDEKETSASAVLTTLFEQSDSDNTDESEESTESVKLQDSKSDKLMHGEKTHSIGSGEHVTTDAEADAETEKEPPVPTALSRIRELIWPTLLPEEQGPWEFRGPTLLTMIFFLFNVCLSAASFAGFVIGMLALVNANTLNGLTGSFDPNNRLKNVDIGSALQGFGFSMVFMGLITMSIGVIGSLGCFLNDRRVLNLYAYVAGFTIAVQVMFILYSLMSKSSIEESAKRTLVRHLRDDYEGSENSTKLFSQFMDVSQVYFGCCGILNFTDFNNTPWYNQVNEIQISSLNGTAGNTSAKLTPSTNFSVPCPNVLKMFPVSCCKAKNTLSKIVADRSLQLQNRNCPCHPPGEGNPNTNSPCYDVVRDWLEGKAFVLLGLAVTILGIELSAVTNAISIGNKFKKDAEKKAKEKAKKQKARKTLEDEDDDGERGSKKRSKGKGETKGTGEKGKRQKQVPRKESLV